METLRSLFPTADALLAISPEDLAPVLLRLARARLQPAGFWHDSILNEAGVTGERSSAFASPSPSPRRCRTRRSQIKPGQRLCGAILMRRSAHPS